MKQNLTIKNDEERELIKTTISLFANNHSIDEICKTISKDREIVESIIRNRDWVIRLFDLETWEKVRDYYKVEKQKKLEIENETLIDDIIFYLINSLYHYEQIAQKLFIGTKKVLEVIDNEEYIEQKYGKEVLEQVRNSRYIRKHLAHDRIQGISVLVREPEHRVLVKPTVITVSSYEYNLIDKASLFLKYSGDAKQASFNSQYTLNDIVTSMKDIRLEDLLLDSVYKEVSDLIEIESILTHNRMTERSELIRNVILSTHKNNGDLNKIEKDLDYSEKIIRRVLQHPYVNIVCSNLGLNISIEMLHRKEDNVSISGVQLTSVDRMSTILSEAEEEKQLVLSIADYITENNASYRDAAEKFHLSKSTIGEKMKYSLPHISDEKADKVNEIIENHTSTKAIDDEKIKERILLEAELILRGYTVSQAAYLINNSDSSAQRDISIRLPLISEEKSKEIENIRNKPKKISPEIIDRVLLEYELLMRGYSLNQVGYLVNASYSTVQRDLRQKLPKISEEKGKAAEKKLDRNKHTLSRKN